MFCGKPNVLLLCLTQCNLCNEWCVGKAPEVKFKLFESTGCPFTLPTQYLTLSHLSFTFDTTLPSRFIRININLLIVILTTWLVFLLHSQGYNCHTIDYTHSSVIFTKEVYVSFILFSFKVIKQYKNKKRIELRVYSTPAISNCVIASHIGNSKDFRKHCSLLQYVIIKRVFILTSSRMGFPLRYHIAVIWSIWYIHDVMNGCDYQPNNYIQ